MTKGASKFSRMIRAPIRALGRARDFYVTSMTGCAGKIPHGAMAMGGPAAIPPRSFSFQQQQRISSSDDDLRELIRIASLSARPSSKPKSPIGRSQSVVVGRIDEDSPCEFQDEIRVGSNLLFSRSISCAAARPKTKTSRLGVFA